MTTICSWLIAATVSILWLSPLLASAQTLETNAIYKIKNQCSGKSLSVLNSSSTEGAAIIVRADSGAPSQRWQLLSAPDGSITLAAQHNQMVVDANYGGIENGTAYILWPQNAGANQRFRAIANRDGTYKLIAQHAASRALDVAGAGTADNTPVHLWDDNGTCAQHWTFEKQGGNPLSADKITLPIEVLGAKDHIEAVTVSVDNAAGISRLWVQCHRCAYREAALNKKVKASVRVNTGAWINLDDATVGPTGVEPPDRAYGGSAGGIASGINTVRFSVPVAGVVNGKNTIEFRFNGSDNFTLGYRILSMNFLRGDGSAAMTANNFSVDDPANWSTQFSAADISAGKALWNGSIALKEHPDSTNKLRATCAACHAADGRDLKYFNYSSKSIRERSKFHGLNEAEANQIAAYIRSLPIAFSANARPWNPPYQPGPGLDSKPVSDWAAGAGLNAVLDSDAAMTPYLFPGGTGVASMRDVMNVTKTLNMRELPISLQLPDWNEWLPETHPIDLVGDAFDTLPVNAGLSLNKYYESIEETLKTNNVDALIANGWLQGNLTRFAEISTDLPTAIPLRDAATNAGIDVNAHFLSVIQWGAVKQWELMHTYGLEDKAPRMKGAYGEARSWLSDRRNVFEMAPHRITDDGKRSHQTLLIGKTKSTAWYQLQLVLNAGNRTAKAQLWPLDWNYQPDHITDLKTKVPGPSQPVRYLASHIKMHQLYHDGRPLATTNFGIRQVSPHRWAPQGALLDDLPIAWRANAYSGLINMLIDDVSAYGVGEWQRGSPVNNILEPTSYVPNMLARNTLDAQCHQGRYADCWYSVIPHFRLAGVDNVTLTRMIEWSASVWPAGNWNALR